MAIAWTPQMATGARTLDDDHRRIIARANALLAAVAEDADSRTTEHALRALGDAALRHFSRHADCTVIDRCPAIQVNGEARAEFIAVLERFRLQDERQGGGAEVAEGLQRDLGAWVTRFFPGPYGDRLPCLPFG